MIERAVGLFSRSIIRYDMVYSGNTVRRVFLVGFSAHVKSALTASGIKCISCGAGKHDDISYMDLMEGGRYPSTRNGSIVQDQDIEELLRQDTNIWLSYERKDVNRVSMSTNQVSEIRSMISAHFIYFREFLSTGFDAIVFASLPHEGFDNVIYLVARMLGIKTVRMWQIPWMSRTLELLDDETLCEASDRASKRMISELSSSENLQMEEFKECLSGEKTLFYMRDIKPSRLKGVLSARRIPDYIRRPYRIATDLVLTAKYRRYKRKIKQLASRSAEDLAGSFVYYPLHLQPELTTTALGGVYVDQVLALNTLSHICERKGKRVVVKDNPKQCYSNRGSMFFRYISDLSNVDIVSSSVQSMYLLTKAAAVATVSGTAGIEGLWHGKPVICMGDIWWKSWHGVYTLDEFEHKKDFFADDQMVDSRYYIEKMLRQLCVGTFPGCSDEDYRDSYGIDELENSKRIASAINDLIK